LGQGGALTIEPKRAPLPDRIAGNDSRSLLIRDLKDGSILKTGDRLSAYPKSERISRVDLDAQNRG